MSNSPLLSLGCNRGHVRTHDGRSSLCEDQECRLPRSRTKELTHVTLLPAPCCGTLVPSLRARAFFLAPCGRTLFSCTVGLDPGAFSVQSDPFSCTLGPNPRAFSVWSDPFSCTVGPDPGACSIGLDPCACSMFSLGEVVIARF
jgi:hypothetical protein